MIESGISGNQYTIVGRFSAASYSTHLCIARKLFWSILVAPINAKLLESTLRIQNYQKLRRQKDGRFETQERYQISIECHLVFLLCFHQVLTVS